MVVHWTKYALQDLHEYYNYSHKNNVYEYIESIIKNVGVLKTSPNLGRIYTYSHQFIIRKFVYKEHIILYYVEKNTIHILVAVHHKQNINTKLKFIRNFVEDDFM